MIFALIFPVVFPQATKHFGERTLEEVKARVVRINAEVEEVGASLYGLKTALGKHTKGKVSPLKYDASDDGHAALRSAVKATDPNGETLIIMDKIIAGEELIARREALMGRLSAVVTKIEQWLSSGSFYQTKFDTAYLKALSSKTVWNKEERADAAVFGLQRKEPAASAGAASLESAGAKRGRPTGS